MSFANRLRAFAFRVRTFALALAEPGQRVVEITINSEKFGELDFDEPELKYEDPEDEP